MLEHDIRYTTVEDKPFLKQMLSNPKDLKYYEMSSEKEIEMVANSWINCAKQKACITLTINGIPRGVASLIISPYKKMSHCGLFHIVIDKDFRRKGLGRALLKNLLNLSKNYLNLESIHGEFFGDNPIIHLLEELNFEKLAYQENYVKEDNTYLNRSLFAKYF